MFNLIARWLEKRSIEKERRRFELGFGFVMTQYFHHKEPEFAIRDHFAAYRNIDHDEFDEGALTALSMIPSDAHLRGQAGYRPRIVLMTDIEYRKLQTSS